MPEKILINTYEDIVKYKNEIIGNIENFNFNIDLSKPLVIKINYSDNRQGTINTSIMKGFLSLQRAINNIYSYNKNGYIKKLTQKEYKDLELIITVNKGSDKYSIFLNDIMNKLINNIESTQLFVILLAGILTFGSINIYKIYSKRKEKEIDSNLMKNKDEILKSVILGPNKMIYNMSKNSKSIEIEKEKKLSEDVIKNIKHFNESPKEDFILEDTEIKIFKIGSIECNTNKPIIVDVQINNSEEFKKIHIKKEFINDIMPQILNDIISIKGTLSFSFSKNNKEKITLQKILK